MKKQFIELLICPNCLPKESPLIPNIELESGGDIETGILSCPKCMASFPIHEGVAMLDPSQEPLTKDTQHPDILASYLWSQYSDLLGDELSSKAYGTWCKEIQPHRGIALDIGCAVGRYIYEMSTKCSFAVGVDSCFTFIKAARELMKNRQITGYLQDEGELTKRITVTLPQNWRTDNVEFFVGNALHLPLRNNSISSVASLNVIDRVNAPLQHLHEMNRVIRDSDSQFLLSDPFSWTQDIAKREQWLGGRHDGPYAGRGIDNIKRMLEGGHDGLAPRWQVTSPDYVWWKVKTHSNHYELMQSCFIKARRF